MTRTFSERLWITAGVGLTTANLVMVFIGNIPAVNGMTTVLGGVMTAIIWDDTR